jgi:hypothetical protein
LFYTQFVDKIQAVGLSTARGCAIIVTFVGATLRGGGGVL